MDDRVRNSAVSVLDWRAARARMVAEQMRDVHDPRVLDVLLRVPRHLFVPEHARHEAYDDHPVPIGFGQTISQPYIVGFMTQTLEVGPTDRVLEIGTGSGYQTAVLAELARAVFSIEIVPELAERARRTVEEHGCRNVEIRTGDGYAGWPEQAPFDRIIATAAPKDVPQALVDQLADGGVLVLPVGDWDQDVHVVRKRHGGIQSRRVLPVRFVPMVRPRDGSDGA